MKTISRLRAEIFNNIKTFYNEYKLIEKIETFKKFKKKYIKLIKEQLKNFEKEFIK